MKQSPVKHLSRKNELRGTFGILQADEGDGNDGDEDLIQHLTTN